MYIWQGSFDLVLNLLCLQTSVCKNEMFNKNALFPLQHVLVFNLPLPPFFPLHYRKGGEIWNVQPSKSGYFPVYKRAQINGICFFLGLSHIFL